MREPLNASIATRKKGRRLAMVPREEERETIQSAQVDCCREKNSVRAVQRGKGEEKRTRKK
jgi:hypothetical protein